MAFQMIDRIKRLVCSHGYRLGGHQADNQSADKAGTGGRSNRVHIFELHIGVFEGAFHQPVKRFNMGACGDFRHYTTIRFVFGDLAEHHIGQNMPFAAIVAFNDGGGCFVATGLYSKNAHLRLDPACLLTLCNIFRKPGIMDGAICKQHP